MTRQQHRQQYIVSDIDMGVIMVYRLYNWSSSFYFGGGYAVFEEEGGGGPGGGG